MKAEVVLEGIAPLLMNRFPAEEAERPARRRGEVPTHDEECEKAMYKNEEGSTSLQAGFPPFLFSRGQSS